MDRRDDTVVVECGDQDERVHARRQRIDQRTKSRKEDGQTSLENNQTVSETNHRKQQVANSLSTVDRMKASTLESVTSIRVEADHVENSRRVQEEDRRQKRLHVMQNEALASGTKNASIEVRWSELTKYNMPLELDDEIKKQDSNCKTILDSKNKVIDSFQREIKVKDDEYVKALKRQSEDIENLLTRMGSQYKELHHQYEVELEAIEHAFLTERCEIIETNRNDIDGLFEKRRVMEINFMESKQERDAKYQQELDDLRSKDTEDYNQLKIKLESDIQTLEQQLEEMRATYQLNTEKLEYNYRVLTERDTENSATLAQQKRKLGRLKDTLSTLTSKYQTMDSKYKTENIELTEEYSRITKQYKDLQHKFKHFEIADNQKYQSVWDMHKGEIVNMVNRLLAADKCIEEQQMGLQWKEPDSSLFECYSSSFTTIQTSPQEQQPEQQSEKQVVTRTRVADAKVTYMLEMLSAETGFLVDDTPGLDNQEEYANAILKAINVEDEDDIQKLLGYFFEKVDDDEEDAFAFDLATDKKSKLQTLGLKIKPDQIVTVLTTFANERSKGELNPKQNTKKMDTQGQIERQKRDSKEEIEYWDRLADIVPERTCRIWTALESGLQKYTTVLIQRSEQVEEVHTLTRQNEELKRLLNQYLGSKVVQDLIIPPTQTLSP